MSLSDSPRHDEASLDEARAAMAAIFGFRDFRPGQGEIIEAVLDGQNVLAVMPTGRGKSLCYQLPAVVPAGSPSSFLRSSR